MLSVARGQPCISSVADVLPGAGACGGDGAAAGRASSVAGRATAHNTATVRTVVVVPYRLWYTSFLQARTGPAATSASATYSVWRMWTGQQALPMQQGG